jgi:hypothetical protein
MSDYERITVLPTREVFRRAHGILTERAGLKPTRESHHSATYGGGEGTVTIDVHRHGPTAVVTARTNQLRTSKIDNVVRYLMNQLPYQHDDPGRE